MSNKQWVPHGVVSLSIIKNVSVVRAWRMYRSMSEHDMIERIAADGGPSLTIEQYLELEALEHDRMTPEQVAYLAGALRIAKLQLDW